MRSILFFLISFPILALAQTNTYRCNLKSHNDSLQFTMSDPRRPQPVIIGANGGNPLKKLAEFVTPDREVIILLFEDLGAGRGHISNFIEDGGGFRAVHQRWSNPDPKAGFYGGCLSL